MNRFIVFCCLTFVSACSPQQDIYSDYVARLQRVLDTSTSLPRESLTPPKFPDARDLKRVPPDQSISIREFLSLRNCKLHTVLAHRNSLIGKVAQSSQLLFNDLDILATGPQCLSRLTDKTLANKLAMLLQQKQDNIGHSLWKAVLAEQENRSFWSSAKQPADYPSQLPNQTVSSLAALNTFIDSVLSGHYAFNQSDYNKIEKHLGELRFGDGGMLLLHYFKLNNSLAHANALIQNRLDRPLCLAPAPTPKARQFQNVISEVFIKKFQRQAVLLNQREAQLIPSYWQLEQKLIKYAPPVYQDWAHRRDQLIAQAKSATKRHAQAIQTLYQQCGLTAGQSIR